MRTAAILFLLAGAVSAPALSQSAPPPVRKVAWRQALAHDGMVRLWNPAGSTRVVAWDRDSVEVTGVVQADDQFHCGGSTRGVKCAVDGPPQSSVRRAAAVLEVRVPRRAQLWIKSESADVSVAGLHGDLDVYSVSGLIRVEGTVHAASLETMGGDIRLSGTAASLRARTASGNVAVHATVQDATVSSVSGSLTLTGGGFQRGRFESIDGAIHWDGPVAAGAVLDFSTHGGPVRMRLPATTAGEFTLSSFQGTLRSNLPGRELRAVGDASGKPVTLLLGSAHGARVNVRTFKGAVLLLRQ